ncbi:MAG: alpha/beta-hydrolase family protein [Kiloniellales bacterium]|nr:alpha/beta-hydrolase family protein [Kiloniellales bacterium]
MSVLRWSRRRFLAYGAGFSLPGLIGAGVLFALSLAPSLIPRDALTQGILSGVVAAIGYWLGLALVWLWTFLEFPLPAGKWVRAARIVLSAATILFVGFLLWHGAAWQDSLRKFLGLEPLEAIYAPVVLLTAVPLALLLREIGRLFAWTAGGISRLLDRIMPRRVSLFLGVLLAAYLLTQLVSGTIGRFTVESLDAMFLALDQLIDDEIAPPSEDLATGSAKSLVSWKNLGRQGRNFVSSGPSREAIEDVTGAPAKRPLRVYVGLGAAETPEERAALALEEMKRVGAFDRAVLVVATPTGTGWVDNAAVDTLEYLHRGDTAIVAQQYSYLMSYVSLFLEPGYSKASARALFDAVYRHWTGLPRDDRPRLYLQGLSLGSSGSEQSMNLYMVLADLIHGAVWSGPPFTNPDWAAFTRGRNPDSPYWLPRYGDGSLVRFTNQENALDIPGARWGPVRLVYLQYASDPITFFSTDLFYREPSWLTGERGPDVSPDFQWFPIVTGFQVAFDMIGASAIGHGRGHLFAAAHYIDAWIAVTEPDGWTEADLARLKARFEE